MFIVRDRIIFIFGHVLWGGVTLKSSLQDSIRSKSHITSKRSTKKVGFPLRFTEAVVGYFQTVLAVNEDDENIIPDWSFEEQKMDFCVRIPFSTENEEISRKFVKS